MSEEMPNHLEQPDPNNTFAYDVFVSYSTADAPWVHATLLPQLGAAQVRVITSEVFELGAPKASEFERAVLSSGKTLLVLTPTSLEDEWTEFAASLVHTLDPASRERRFIPIIKESCKLPLRLQGLIAFDATGATNWERLIEAVRTPLPEPPAAIPMQSIPTPSQKISTTKEELYDEANSAYQAQQRLPPPYADWMYDQATGVFTNTKNNGDTITLGEELSSVVYDADWFWKALGKRRTGIKIAVDCNWSNGSSERLYFVVDRSSGVYLPIPSIVDGKAIIYTHHNMVGKIINSASVGELMYSTYIRNSGVPIK